MIRTYLLMLLASSIALNSQDIVENVEVKPKSFIGINIGGLAPNTNYGENNFEIDAFFRHRFKNNYYCVNANYIHYKDNSVTKNDYLLTLGDLHIFDPFFSSDSIISISHCFGVDIGVLYKNNGLYYCAFSFNSGFIWKIIKHIYWETVLKFNYNHSDQYHFGIKTGISYSF